MSRTTLAIAVTFLTIGGWCGIAHARDTSVKVVLDGQYWFCHTDPTGWSLVDFKAVCSMIDAGGKGEFVEFMVDSKGKVRRKPQSPRKTPAQLPLRGSYS